MTFVQALARIQSLEKMELQGCFAKVWPDYLERSMRLKV